MIERRYVAISPPGRCEYLRDQTWQFQHLLGPITPDEYMQRLAQGWRRLGPALFRPVCPSCRMCRSLRIPVERFGPSRSQRRAWSLNRNRIRLEVRDPNPTAEKRALHERFHRYQADAKGWPVPPAEHIDWFSRNPFPSEEWNYTLDGRLVGVGYVDRLSEGLSAIYFFYDPDHRDRSPGTYNVLMLIERARELGLRHVYLGYYVAGCRSLEYKARFRPNEVLGADGTWREFER